MNAAAPSLGYPLALPPKLAEAVWQMMLEVQLAGRLPQTTVAAVETIFRIQAVILGTVDEPDEDEEQPDGDAALADSEAPAGGKEGRAAPSRWAKWVRVFLEWRQLSLDLREPQESVILVRRK
jgi:hypothetical protein